MFFLFHTTTTTTKYYQKRKNKIVTGHINKLLLHVFVSTYREDVAPSPCAWASLCGYKAKQGYVIYRVRVRRGGRKRSVSKGIVYGQGVTQLKFQRSLCSIAEERVVRKLKEVYGCWTLIKLINIQCTSILRLFLWIRLILSFGSNWLRKTVHKYQ